MYQQPVASSGFWFSLSSWLASLFQPTAGGAPAPDPLRGRKGLPLLQIGVAAGLTSLPQLPGGVPKGYLRVLVFGADSSLLSQQTQQLSTRALGGYDSLKVQVIVPQDGYVTAYVGNESNVDVFFDDVRVDHRPGLQVQENQYDPWGLSLAGLDYSSPGIRGLNQYQFNGKERQLDLGLNWSDYGARFYDPARGPVWYGVDPLADKMRRWSPYTFSFDNPLRFMDPDGMGPLEIKITGNASAMEAYKNTVSAATGGFYAVNVDAKSGKVSLVETGISNLGFKMTAEQTAFYKDYSAVVNSTVVVNQVAVENDPNTVVDSYQTGAIDMADVAEFDNAGGRAASSAGALIHSTVEQHEKAKLGLPAGSMGATTTDAKGNKTYTDYNANHSTAISAEDSTNGNTRGVGGNENVFREKDGTTTTQTVTPTSSGGVTITKIP